MPSQLADAHILAQQRLRELAAAAVTTAWTSLPGYDEKDVAPWLRAAVPPLVAIRRQSAAITDAYVARSVGRQPLGLATPKIRAGIPDSEVYRRPFVTVWTALKNGTAWEAAVNQGLARATAAAATDIQLTMREALRDIAADDPQIVGYARVPDAGACEFCRLVAGQRYRTSQLMPIHPHCGCGVDVITQANRHEFTGDTVHDRDGVVVQEHGELGPVLADPAHHFEVLA